jgi:hypothetical protein
VSVEAANTTAGLPVVNQALEPAWVRTGSASTKKAYEAALTFEQTLVEQLARSLTATSGLNGEAAQGGEDSSEGGGSPSAGANSGELSSLLPQALTSGVMNAGGLGLAAQLTRGLPGAQGTAHQPQDAPARSGAGIGAPAPTTAPAGAGDTGATSAASSGGTAS